MQESILLKALIGSHNYGINDENSDKDYKQFILPTFNDLYDHKVRSSAVTKQEGNIDIETKDIRLLIELLKKANPAYLEIMFSVEIYVNPIFQHIWDFIYAHRELIVKYNLKNLVNATVGMMYQKHSNFIKCTESTQHLCDKFGYDTKNFCHLARLCYLLQDYEHDEFTDYQSKLTKHKEYLLDVKRGVLSLESAKKLGEYFLLLANKCKDTYVNTAKEKYEHDVIFTTLDQMIKNLVRDNL